MYPLSGVQVGVRSLACDNRPWDSLRRRAFKGLREAYLSGASDKGPPGDLIDLFSVTVALHQLCLSLNLIGMMWMLEFPSQAGISLLRQLLPAACVYRINSDQGAVFVASNPDFPTKRWRAPLLALLSTHPPGFLALLKAFGFRRHLLFTALARWTADFVGRSRWCWFSRISFSF